MARKDKFWVKFLLPKYGGAPDFDPHWEHELVISVLKGRDKNILEVFWPANLA